LQRGMGTVPYDRCKYSDATREKRATLVERNDEPLEEGGMNKIIALICVVSWSGFWAFGYLALSAGVEDQRQIIVAGLLAFVGFLTGMFTYMRLSRDIR
jgi:hypothetical protein